MVEGSSINYVDVDIDSPQLQCQFLRLRRGVCLVDTTAWNNRLVFIFLWKKEFFTPNSSWRQHSNPPYEAKAYPQQNVALMSVAVHSAYNCSIHSLIVLCFTQGKRLSNALEFRATSKWLSMTASVHCGPLQFEQLCSPWDLWMQILAVWLCDWVF